MTLQNLQIFVAVYEEKSFTKAAAKLYISQPAVSMMIAEMERAYHVQLFERRKRTLSVTAIGEHIYRYARRILDLYQEMGSSIGEKNHTDTLRIGCGIAFGKMSMPRVIEKYNQLYAKDNLLVTVNSSEVIEPMLENGELDIGIMEGTLKSTKLQREPLQKNPIVAFCNVEHPLAQLSRVNAADLAKCKLLLREKFSPVRNSIDIYFQSNNLVAAPIWESISAIALIEAVKRNLGVSFLPLDHLKPWLDSSLKILDTPDLHLFRFINIVYRERRDDSPAFERFIACCRELTGDLEQKQDGGLT